MEECGSSAGWQDNLCSTMNKAIPKTNVPLGYTDTEMPNENQAWKEKSKQFLF